MMNLNNFEMYMDKVIVERGKDYFDQGHVEKIEETHENHFTAYIAGTDNYTVEVVINDEADIINSYCDCPYDWGDYCKHEAAAFYALREKENRVEGQSSNKQQASKKTDLKTILSSLSQDELIKIIVNLTKEYPDIKKKLLFTYASVEDEIVSSKKLIKEYINRYKRHGIIQWNQVDDALQGAYMTLEKVNEKLQNGESESAVLLSITVLSIVVDMLAYCDDSNGFSGSVIEESLAMIEEAVSMTVEHMTDGEQEKLFTIIMKEALHERYQGWMDWKLSLLSCCIYFCNKADLRKQLEDQLNSMLETMTSDSWVDKYGKENVKLLQLELIEQFDGNDQALQFIQDHVNFGPFREKAIVYLLEKEEYSEVIKLCEEGKKVDKDYRGLVHQWEKYQLQAYERLGDVQKQREMMLAFVYKNEYTYYPRLKLLYQEEEWKEVLPDILETFEKQSYIPSAYLEILKEENLHDKLLQYCKRNVSSIKDLYPHLIKDYSDEVNELFQNYIQVEAEKSNDRKKYKHVCSQIKLYKKVFGADHVQVIIEYLKQKYPRRPAFLDELGKIK